MNTNYLFVVLFNLICVYLTSADDEWTVPKLNKLSNENIKELERLAKVTQNVASLGANLRDNLQPRLSRNMPSSTANFQSNKFKESRQSSKNESVVNNLVSEDENQTRSEEREEVDESTTYNFYPSRRGATTKKKAPVRRAFFWPIVHEFEVSIQSPRGLL